MTNSRRGRLRVSIALGLSLSLGAVQLSTVGSPAQAAPVACDPDLLAVIGAPGEAIGRLVGAGVVEARYESFEGNSCIKSLRLPKAHSRDSFGASMARGYFNNDSREDLAVGVPGLDVGKRKNAGGVAIFYGSATGLKFGKLITQSSKGIPGKTQSGARFGAALATDGYSGDRAYQLRIGVPGKKVSGHKRAGAFVDLTYRRGTLIRARQITLASRGIPGSPGTDDQLGAALTGSYAVGAPGRKVNGQAGAGAVLVYYVNYQGGKLVLPATLLTQASPGIPDVPEAGDHFGAALTRHWIGVPGESVVRDGGIETVLRAGAVDRYYAGRWVDNPGFKPTEISAGAAGVPGKALPGDNFGASLVEVGGYVDDTEWKAQGLVVGTPGANVGGHAAAGSATVIGVNEPLPDDGGEFSLTGHNQLLTAPSPTTGARFGTSFAVTFGNLDYDSTGALIGAPGAGGGRVYRSEAADAGFGVPWTILETWKQQAGTPEAGDAFGASLATHAN